ncbi:PTS sugar transporter subunit IIB [[Eubacterium] hominis]|uniref:PTS sugar transporter subunit IIB n=1 Tax=[Eubacterium] hominis TaxID=2764325 RepID=UPI003A4DEA53
MKKVYLFCSAGMSTSMLASSMQDAADAHFLPIEVQAFALNQMEDILTFDQPDCILLGPQAKFMYQETLNRFGDRDIPIAVIDDVAYGMMNGEKVLKTAIKLIKKLPA